MAYNYDRSIHYVLVKDSKMQAVHFSPLLCADDMATIRGIGSELHFFLHHMGKS